MNSPSNGFAKDLAPLARPSQASADGSGAGGRRLDRGYTAWRLGAARQPTPRIRGRTPQLGGVVRARSVVVGVSLLFLIVALALVSLVLGSYSLSIDQIVAVFQGGGLPLDRTVVFEWRMPRTLAALVLGAVLALSGALFQSVTRNPLASPDILGLSNGAFTGVLLVITLFSGGWAMMTTGAIVGGALAALAIWALAYRGGIQGFRLIIIGIGISAILASLNTWMLLQIELEAALFATSWGAGTLNGITAGPVLGTSLIAVPFVLALIVLAPRMRQLDLGDDAAASSGVNPRIVRSTALFIGVALVSLATAVTGPVAFVALAAPQIARRIARIPYVSLGLSALTGAVLLLSSDLIAQHAFAVPLPAGVVTVSIGGIYLVVTLVQEIRRRA